MKIPKFDRNCDITVRDDSALPAIIKLSRGRRIYDGAPNGDRATADECSDWTTPDAKMSAHWPIFPRENAQCLYNRVIIAAERNAILAGDVCWAKNDPLWNESKLTARRSYLFSVPSWTLIRILSSEVDGHYERVRRTVLVSLFLIKPEA